MSLVILRDSLIETGCNQPDQVVTLINACIDSGIETGPEIVSTVSDLGFAKSYVGLILKKNARSHSERYQWVREADGRYRAHD